MDVFEPSPAAGAGIRKGDRIVAIDGVAISDRDCRHRPAEPSRDPRSLTIERDDERFDVTITPAILLP